jgi:transposase
MPRAPTRGNDAADAAAICEAVTRPSMRFVPVKTEDMQAAKMLHTSRRLLVDQRTRAINSLRGQLAELGHVAPTGAVGLAQLVALVTAPAEESRLPKMARLALAPLVEEIGRLRAAIAELERAIREAHRANETSRRLQTIPGIGPITASAILATVPDAAAFRDSRHFAAWVGLVPQQNSTGGKPRLGRITKKGDRYLRTLLVTGATALLRSHGKLSARHRAWLERLKAKKPARLVTVALSNKLARIVWALLAKGTRYRGDDAGAGADTRLGGVGNTAVVAAAVGDAAATRRPARANEVMASVPDPRSAKPASRQAPLPARRDDGVPTSGHHQGQRPDVPRIKAGHMTAPNCRHQIATPLPRRGRPHMTIAHAGDHGQGRPLRPATPTSAGDDALALVAMAR